MEADTLGNKRCSVCREYKPVTEFTKDKYSRSGLHSRCRPCNKEYGTEWDRANPQRAIFRNKKGHAKSRGTEFTITFDDVSWPLHCPVLGLELDYSHRVKKVIRPNSPSFDRIDPTKGYTPGNVIIVSQLANQIKSNATVEELERVAAFYRQLIPTNERTHADQDH